MKKYRAFWNYADDDGDNNDYDNNRDYKDDNDDVNNDYPVKYLWLSEKRLEERKTCAHFYTHTHTHLHTQNHFHVSIFKRFTQTWPIFRLVFKRQSAIKLFRLSAFLFFQPISLFSSFLFALFLFVYSAPR